MAWSRALWNSRNCSSRSSTWFLSESLVKTPIALVSRRRCSREPRSRVFGVALSGGGWLSCSGALCFGAGSPVGGALFREGDGSAGGAEAETVGGSVRGGAISAARPVSGAFVGVGAGPTASRLTAPPDGRELGGVPSLAWQSKTRTLTAHVPALLPIVTVFRSPLPSTGASIPACLRFGAGCESCFGGPARGRCHDLVLECPG